jgi:hypothetical protein
LRPRSSLHHPQPVNLRFHSPMVPLALLGRPSPPRYQLHSTHIRLFPLPK